jgi:hypothetical protein
MPNYANKIDDNQGSNEQISFIKKSKTLSSKKHFLSPKKLHESINVNIPNPSLENINEYSGSEY